MAGFCGVVYPLLEAVDDDDDDDDLVEDEEEEEEFEDASEERDIGLRRLIWSATLEQQSPLVEAAEEPGLLPVGVDTAEVTGEPAIDATWGM